MLYPGEGSETSSLEFLGRGVTIRRVGCGPDVERMRSQIAEHDGRVDAIAVEGVPARLQLGSERAEHAEGSSLLRAFKRTPVVDGSGVRPGLERWAVLLAERAQPGLFSDKRTVMVPALNSTLR